MNVSVCIGEQKDDEVGNIYGRPNVSRSPVASRSTLTSPTLKSGYEKYRFESKYTPTPLSAGFFLLYKFFNECTRGNILER